jgi:hypothetical protein
MNKNARLPIIIVVSVIIILLASCFVSAQNVNAPSFKWENEYPGPSSIGHSVSNLIQTNDGGYIFDGVSNSYYYSIDDGTSSSPTTIITKTNSAGVLEWQNHYLYSIFQPFSLKCVGLFQTSDQGYLFAEPGNKTSGFELIKLDSNGATQWNKTLDYSGCSKMILSYNGGLAFVGTNDSEVWLAKADSSGNIQWHATYEAKFDRGVTQFIQTLDGSYLMLGSSIIDPNLEGSPATLVMLKINSAGTLLWEKTYDTNMSSWEGQSLIQTSDNDYLIADNTDTSAVVFKTDQNGVILWTKDYPSIGNIDSVIEVSDGGLALGGVDNTHIILVKADSLGNVEWSITGGNLNAGPYAKFGVGVLFYDSVNCIVESSDGSLVLAGVSDNQNPYQASYYITKTQSFLTNPAQTPFLPYVPSSLPSPTTPSTHITNFLINSMLVFTAVTVVVLVVVIGSLLLFSRHRKNQVKKV